MWWLFILGLSWEIRTYAGGQAVGVGRADTEMRCEYTWHAKQDGRVIEASIPWVWGKVGWVRGAVQTSAPRRGSATLPWRR